MKEIRLEPLTAYTNYLISSRQLEVWGEAKLDAFWPMAQDALVIQLRTYLWSQAYGRAESAFEIPTSAWQHVKQDWFPTFSRWLRRPPRYRIERRRYRVFESYPDFRSVPGQEAILLINEAKPA